jgi:hypothetical protein
MSRPSVIARPLAEARRILEATGAHEIAVKYTSPPSKPPPAGPQRVLRERVTSEGIELVVAACVPSPEGKTSDD